MKSLVTGPDGFVGRHLCKWLSAAGHEVVEARASGGPNGFDIRDSESVTKVLSATRPEAVVHFAAVSSVAQSHRDPAEAFAVNAVGTVNLLAASRKVCPDARLLVIGSGEVYGRAAKPGPTPEDAPLEPLSPYAVSKVAAEMAALQFHRSYGTNVVCTRSFSHLGTGQATQFVVPSFAEQIAKIKKGAARPVLLTGDLSPVRDFLHVEDVVAAYGLILTSGASGTVYNVASGSARSVRSLLDEMLVLAEVTADVEVDPARVRPVEIPSLIGDPSRLGALGWTPKHDVTTALRDVLREHGALAASS
jgi:GDP-4-dehydro-6-deoxy-D-mannose reductase